jgi:hypothetical protein
LILLLEAEMLKSRSKRLIRENAVHGRLIYLIFALAIMVLPQICFADPITPNIWNEFSFVQVGVQARGCSPADPSGLACTPGPDSLFIGAPSWTYTAPPQGSLLKVTDAFASGDAFLVLDLGAVLGTTPGVPPGFSCGSDPDACFSNPAISHNQFFLQAGAHSITITPIVVQQIGAAYLRVDPVPEPPSLVLLCFGSLGAVMKIAKRH